MLTRETMFQCTVGTATRMTPIWIIFGLFTGAFLAPVMLDWSYAAAMMILCSFAGLLMAILHRLIALKIFHHWLHQWRRHSLPVSFGRFTNIH